MTALQQVQSVLPELTTLEKYQLLQTIMADIQYPGRAIVHTPGVVGGSARIDGSRIPVWILVNFRKIGVEDTELLEDYPTLSRGDLRNVWAYYEQHQAEIDDDIYQNENR